MSSITRKKTAIASIGAVGVAALIGIASLVPLGAAWTDTKPANITISTASLSLGVSDEDNSGTIDVSFPNMKPGDLKTASFTLHNNGSIDGTVNVGSAFYDAINPSNPNVTYQNLRVGAGATSGSIALSAANSLPSGGWDLGTLAAGQSKTYYFDVKLGAGAGNEWKNQVFGGKLPVTLTQL